MTRDVLEHNLRRLLRQSYVPALPAPHFRDRLESLFVAELRRRAAERARPARAARAPGARLFLALAAAVVAALVGWRFFAGPSMPARASLLARGEVALGLPDGRWRAAGAEERSQGLSVPTSVRFVATPEEVAFELHAAAGLVHLAPRSELELGLDGSGAGTDARTAAETTFTLRRGAAWFTGAGERRELVLDVPTSLREPARPAAPFLAGAASAAGRETPATTPAPAAIPSAPAARAFAGHVAVADGAALPAFTIALLPERIANQSRPPVRREFTAGDGFFEWPDPPRGKQRVFAYAEGYALRTLGEFDFSLALPELMIELERGVSLRGSVLDAQGSPIPNAHVFSESEAPTDGLLFDHADFAFWLPIQAQSGADGRFELAHVTPGVHTLRAGAEGFAPTWLDGVQAPAGPGDELTFTLGPGGAIEGQVARGDGGPEVGTELVAVAMDQTQRSRQSFALTRTDDAGHYRFEHLPPITILVVHVDADQRPDVRPVQVSEAATVKVDFLPTQRGIRLHGRLLDRAGQPVAHRNLGLFDAESASWNQDWVASSTADDGAYAFEGVQPGRYALYLVDDLGRGLRCVDELELGAQPLEREHDIVVPAGRFDVRVRVAQSQKPLEQAGLIVMRVEPDGRESFAGYGSTDAEGRCAFVEQRPGRYTVTAYPAQDGLGFTQSEPVDVGEQPGPTLELLLEPGGAVNVLVRGQDGRALEGASVVFHDEGGHEHHFSRVPLTDAAGRYHAQGLRPGRYRAQAALAGYQTATTTFELRLGRELDVPILLAPLVPR